MSAYNSEKAQISEKPSDIWAAGIIMFNLLVAYPPFDETDEKIIENILAGNFEIQEELWKNVSLEATDLVRKY